MHTGTILILIIIMTVIMVCSTQMTLHEGKRRAMPSLRISVEEAKAKRFGLIVDVRSLQERATLGYYPLSIPISISSLQHELPLDISNKQTPILVYSNGDSRAAQGAALIYRMGYHNVGYIEETYLSLMPGSK